MYLTSVFIYFLNHIYLFFIYGSGWSLLLRRLLSSCGELGRPSGVGFSLQCLLLLQGKRSKGVRASIVGLLDSRP